MEEDRSQIIHFITSHIRLTSNPILGNKVNMSPIIKDFIINEEEYAPQNELEKQVKIKRCWAFQSTNEFFEEKNQKNKD